MNATRVYGIDLGTTYSCIAYVDEHGKPVVLPNEDNELTTPSVVFFESAENLVVGQQAKSQVAIYPEQCVSTVKRAMGDPHWQFEAFGQTYRPQDISSFILRKVVRDAEKIVGEDIRNVVITVPAYFGQNEKEATRQAGELAGLNVRNIIPEPTAAALAYGMERDTDEVILVYDLGGGTFDVTLIEVKADELNVISTGGDHQLGGKDWDDAIVEFFAQTIAAETGTSAEAVTEDQETYQELLNMAERFKRALTSRTSFAEATRFEGERVRVELSREKFEDLTRHLLERTLALTDQELEKARERGYSRIDRLLLVGGSTFMPQVTEAVQKRFPFEVRQFDPNQAVAKGAAVFGFKSYLDDQIRIGVAQATGQEAEAVDLQSVDAGVLAAAQKEVASVHGLSLPGLQKLVDKKMVDVTSKSFGIVVIDEYDQEVVANLIQRDHRVPTESTQKFGTHAEGQVQVDLRCMENSFRDESTVAPADCKEIGVAVLEFGRAMPKGSPIEVTFALGPDGLLRLRGVDLSTGRDIKAEFRTESIMSHEEVEQARSRNLALAVS
ncbi:MAG TPA: Hsp70 family protein [Longimicrobium sp.]|jgi:molecular chaperone DnaK (HSP70)|uniref:Hsp70 family protein n=1 Tax=Longimicrobium sp. TaxID=2029185 RepID=UPI002ED9FBB2